MATAEMIAAGGAVLAGGASRRMGRDKATLTIDGQPMAGRVADALAAAGIEPVVLVGGRSVLDLERVEDDHPGEGPLGATITALRAVPAEVVVVLACDLLAPSVAAIHHVVDGLGTADVAVPLVDDRAQWLHAVWRRSCLEALEERFRAGVRSMHEAVHDLTVVRLEAPEPSWYADADRPADLPGSVNRTTPPAE